MISPNGPRFRVVLSGNLVSWIDRLHDQAIQKGLGEAFLSALQICHEQLQSDPENFGDPLYPLPALQMLVYIRAIFPLVVDYAVHNDKPLVFIKGIRLIGQ